MPINDYEPDATELLETYGSYTLLCWLAFVSQLLLRLSHEVHHHRCVASVFVVGKS